ncbi:MAG: hypothetical protein ACI9G1_005214 [Pirellulaceae bacterium]|jgi:hypothetical protein
MGVGGGVFLAQFSVAQLSQVLKSKDFSNRVNPPSGFSRETLEYPDSNYVFTQTRWVSHAKAKDAQGNQKAISVNGQRKGQAPNQGHKPPAGTHEQ